MELVYVHLDDKGEPDGRPYGGKDVGVGGDVYEVKKVGSRSIVNVPNQFGHLLQAVGFLPTGVADADLVERAAHEALAQNEADKKAKPKG